MKAWNQGADPGISRWIQQNDIIPKTQDSFNWLWSEEGVPRTGQRETALVALRMGERGHEPRKTGILSQLQEAREPSLWNSLAAQWLGCGFPGGSDGRESARYAGDPGLIPRSGRPPGGGHSNPLQYSCLENPMDRGAWWATVHGVAQSRTRLSDSHLHFPVLRTWCSYCHGPRPVLDGGAKILQAIWPKKETECPLQLPEKTLDFSSVRPV